MNSIMELPPDSTDVLIVDDGCQYEAFTLLLW